MDDKQRAYISYLRHYDPLSLVSHDIILSTRSCNLHHQWTDRCSAYFPV